MGPTGTGYVDGTSGGTDCAISTAGGSYNGVSTTEECGVRWNDLERQ